MIKLKQRTHKKRKFISTLIPLIISVFCLQIHGFEVNNGTYQKQNLTQNFHLKENLKFDVETDKNYKNFISLDSKEQNTILQSLKAQVLGTKFDSNLISKWSFLQNILELDKALLKPTDQNIKISELKNSNQKLVNFKNSSLVKIQDHSNNQINSTFVKNISTISNLQKSENKKVIVQNISDKNLQKIGKNSFKTLLSSQVVSQTPSIKDVFEIIASKNKISYSNQTDEKDKRFYWNPSASVYNGDNRRFVKNERFTIIEFIPNQNEEKSSLKITKSFSTSLLKNAFDQFRKHVTGDLLITTPKHYGLIGNQRLLVTTSAFDLFYLNSNELSDKQGKEYKTDFISKLIIGFGFQKNLLKWPQGSLDKSYNGYQILSINQRKKGKWQKVGHDFKKAVEQFNKIKNNDKTIILTHSNGKIFKLNGKVYNKDMYWDAYISLAGYLQKKFQDYNSILRNEIDAGFTMQWQIEDERAAQVKVLREWYKGNGEELFKSFTIYAVIYDTETQTFQTKNILQYNYLQKGIEDLISIIDKTILQTDSKSAYLFSVKEGNPIYCSDGLIIESDICQQMIGYALLTGKQSPDIKFSDLNIPQNSKDSHYFGLLEDKQGKIVRKDFKQDYNVAIKQYEKLIHSKNSKYVAGVVSHTSKYLFKNQYSKYSGPSISPIDVYSLITKYCQNKLRIYLSEAHDEKQANLITKKDFEEKQKKQLDNLLQIYTGKGLKLSKSYTFQLVTYDKRSNKIDLLQTLSSQNMSQVFQTFAQTVYQQIILKQQDKAFLYLVKESAPLFCSEGSLQNDKCKRMIGNSIIKQWLTAEQKLTDQSLTPDSPEYAYIAYFMNSHNKNQVKRVKLGKNKDKKMLLDYKAKIKAGKFDVAVLSHSSMPSQYQELVSSQLDLFKFQDVFEMIASYTQNNLGTYKQTLTDEFAANLVTELQLKTEKVIKVQQLKSIYQGSNGDLHKKIKIFALSYDRKTSKINKIFENSFINLKVGIAEASKQIENQIIKQNKNQAYLISSENYPIYCSEKNDLTNRYCQRLIGNAIFNKYLRLDNKLNLQTKIVDQQLNKEDKKFEYVALVWNIYKNQLKVKNIGLGKNKLKAIKNFESLFGKKSEFTIGVIGHTQKQKFLKTKSLLQGDKQNRDVYQMIAVYCQQLGIFKNSATNEKEAFLKSQDEWELQLKQQNATFNGLYRGNNEILNKKYTFNVVTYDKRSNKIQLLFQQKFESMKTAITKMTDQLLLKVIGNEQDKAYLFGVKESNQFYCSEGDLKKPICQRMIGRSIRNDFIIPSKKLVNSFIIPSSIDYKYVAYLQDSKGKILRKDLDADWQKSSKLFSQLISPKAQYKIGVIGHTSLNVWLSPHSKRTGTLKDSDIDELIASYCQQNLKIYAQGDITEQGAQVLTKNQAYEIQKQLAKRLETLTQGNHNALYKTYQFLVMTYDQNTNEIKKLAQNGHKNFKAGLNQIIQSIQASIIIPMKELAFTIQIKETVPFYCSEGEFKNPICQRMIGYSILKGYQRAPKQLVDQQISSNDENYQYVCYVQDSRIKGSVPRKYNLSNDFKLAQKWYNELFNKSEDVSFTVGIMGHTQRQEFLNPKTALTGTLANQDVNQMLTLYIQNSLNKFLKSGTSNQITHLKTKKEWTQQIIKADQKLQQIFKGSSVKLYKPYQFFAAVYNKKTHQISNIYVGKHRSMSQAIKKLNQAVYDYIIRAERTHAYLYGVKETVPFYCSEGDLKTPICQRIIGHSIKNKWFNLNKKLVDTNIPKDSKHWTYIAYLKTSKSSKDVKRIRLTKDLQESLKKYKGLTDGAKSKYKIGLLTHSAQRIWLNPVSQQKGVYFEKDVYEMIVSYCQQKKKLYLKSGADENTAKLLSRKLMDNKMKEKLKKLLNFYQGSNEKLQKQITMGVATYDKYTHKIEQLKWQTYDNMKIGFEDSIEALYKFVFKSYKNKAFVIYIHETSPLYCSEGKDMQNKFCQRIIGHALRKGWLKPNVKMVDSNISEQDEAYQYVAYLQKIGTKQKGKKANKQLGEVQRINLSSDFQVAQDKFMEYLESNKYNIGIIGHTQINDYWNIQTIQEGLLKEKDIDRMLALYCQQKLKIYVNNINDEKKANLKLQRDWKKYLEIEQSKLKQLFLGTDDILSLKYVFYVLAYHKRSHQFSVIYWGKHSSMKNAMSKMSDSVMKNIIELEEDKAYLFGVRETSPFYCSEGSLDKSICKRMIGHAIKSNLIYTNKKLIDRNLDSSDNGYNYVAYLRNKDTKKVSRINLDSNLKISQQKYEKLFAIDDGDYSTGIIGHTGLNKWWSPHVQKTGIIGLNDLYELIAEYCQKTLHIYDKTALNEKDLSLLSRKQLDKTILKENKKIRQIYKGKGEKLYKSYIIFAMIYDKKTREINYLSWQGYYSLKNAMSQISAQIIENVINQKRDVAFTLQSRDTVPFYCSEGELSKPLCRRMIGYSIYKGWQRAPQKMIDRQIPSNDEPYQYAAYLQNSLSKDKKVNRVLLGGDYSKAQQKFKTLFLNKQYNVGVIGHTALSQWSQPVSIKIGKRLNHDVYEMIALYIQENLKNFIKSGIDEKTALLKLNSDWQSYLKVQRQNLKNLFKGTGDILYQAYNFMGVSYNKRTNEIEIIYNQKSKSMKKGVKGLNNAVYHKIILAEEDKAFLYTTQQSVPFYCSEGGLNQKLCQRMIGYLIFNLKVNINRKISDKYIHETEEKYKYNALLRNKKTKAIEKVVLQKDLAKSKLQYKKLTQVNGKYNVGVIGHSSLGKWFSPYSQLKGSKNLMDVYEIIAKYAQDSLNLYKVSGLDENKAELITEKFIKEKRRRAKAFLTSLFVGTGAQLKDPVTLSAITYNRNTHQFSVLNSKKQYISMKVGIAELTYIIYKKVIVPNDDVSFLIISKQSIPLYCSQGQMSDKICKRMIGYALYNNYLNANVKIVDTHTPLDSDESKYVAYLLNTKAKNAQIKRHELTNDLKVSINKFNQLLKKSYQIGIICHSAKQEWQAATSKNLGPYRLIDIYELLATYSQNNLRVYLQNGDRGINEQFAQLTLKKDWEEQLKQQKIKLMSLYRGNSQEQLYKPFTFFLAIYHTRSHYIKQIYQGKHINMKEAMQLLADKALEQVIYPNNDYKFMFFVKETVPLWCQSGNLKDQKFCKRMIGYALKNKWLDPNPKLVDPKIQQDDSRYQYVAYVLNQGNNRVEKISLDKDLQKSKQQYEKLFSGDKKKQKYSAGIIGHSAINDYWNPKSLKKNAKKTEIIVSELLARYCQESLNLYTQNALNENQASLQLKRNMDNNFKQIERNLNSLYRGNQQELYKPYTFSTVQYNKDSDQISFLSTEQFVNMKTAVEVLVKQVYSNIVKENKNSAYIYLVKETVPLYCSEGSLNNIYCQRMIGQALKEGWINADNKFVNININKVDKQYQYVAYLQNKKQKNSQIIKQLLGKDLASAKSKFSKLISGNKAKYTIGILGYTYKQKWEAVVSKFTGKLLNQDVYQMIAKYNQHNLRLWNNNNAIQNEQQANLILKKDFNNQIKQQLQSKKNLYKGTHETLVTPLTFEIITYDRNTQQISLAYSKKQNQMKRAMDEMADYVVNNIYKLQKKMAFIYLVKEKSPIYCSEGQLTNNLCMRMIGYSVQKNWVAPPKQLVNKDLTQAKQSTYVAYLKVKGTNKIVRKTLSSKKEEAIKIYKSLFVSKPISKNKKSKASKKTKTSKQQKKQLKQQKKQQQQKQGPIYEVGIIGHTKLNVWMNPVSAKKGSKKNKDVDELVAGYIQQTLNKYTKTKTTETELKVLTKKQLLTKQQQVSKQIEQRFKGKGDHLFKKYTFYAVYYDKESQKMFLPKSKQFSNMKVAMDALSVQVIDQIVKPQKDRAYIFFAKETVPIYCSEGSLSNTICRRMIGYAIMNHLQQLPTSFVNKHISKKEDQYQYVAYLKNLNSKYSQIQKLYLGKDFKNAIKEFNGKIKVINKQQRFIGVIGHTQMNGFWHPITALQNNKKFYDVYELLSEYLQVNLNIFKEFALDERSAQLQTKRDEDKRLKSQRKMLSQLYKGKGEQLAKHYMFLALGYHRQSNVISKIYQAQHQSMKTAMKRIGESVYRQIVKPDRNIAYLFAVREGSPFYCSEGKLDNKICQRMIGFALRYNLIYPPIKMVNKKIQRDSPDYKFVSYMKNSDSGKIEKIELSTDKKQSLLKFNKMIQNGKYSAGIASHTAYNFWYAKSSDRDGQLKDYDLYRIIAKYIQQKLGLYKNSGVNEQFAQVQTNIQKDQLIKKNFETLMKPFNQLTGKEEFFQPYNLRIVIYYYEKQPIQNILIGEYTNLKSGIKDAVDFIQTVVTKDQLNSKFEVLYYLEEGSPFYCSAGQIDSKVCQIMLGEAIVDQKFQTNGVLGKSGLIDAYACSNNFYAIIQDNKNHISKKQIKQGSWDKAVQEFKQLTKSTGFIGMLYQNSYFGDFKGKHVLIKSKYQKGNNQNEDVYLMVAKYYVNSEIYTKFSVESAGILVQQRKEQLNEIKKQYNQKIQKVEKFAKDLLHNNKGNNSKFVKPFSFTVFSWRNSSNAQNIIKWKPLKANNIQDFLRLSSKRILELNEASKKVHLEPYNIPRTLQGQREFIKQKNIGEFEHVVLLSSGRKPKLMMTSHGVNTAGAQYMIGFAYSQLNNNKIKWWKSGFQNAIKNQLFKISDKYRAQSNSSMGIQRAFFVVQNKETGKEMLKVCNISNSESRKLTREGIQACANDFLSSINDTSKEEGFLMEQYLPIMGSPASLLVQQNQTIKNTFSGYLSFGKWIVKNLPEDFKDKKFTENDIEIPFEGIVESKKRKYYASSFTRQIGDKSLYPRFKYHQSNSLGQFEKFLIDQSLQQNSIHPNFWKDYETKANFKKPTKTSGIIITKGSDNQYYPIATNKKEVSIKDHDSLISIGLFMKQYSNSQSLNLLKNCSNQAQFHGNWTYLYWDQNKQQTVRQVCTQCQAEFDQYLETIKKNNSGLSEYQTQKIAMKNFGKERFSKLYYETMNQKIPEGMSLFSKEGKYIYSAFGRGYDSNGVSKENEVFFTLGKYAQENCKNWQKVYNLQEIGIKPSA